MAGAATQKALLTINTGRSAMFRPLQRRLARGRVPAMLAAALACAAAVPASATVMTALHLNVYRDGSSADWLLGNSRLLADGFDNGNPYAGPNYSGSADTAVYTLQGLAPGANAAQAVREQGGALLLDPGYGASSANALGQTGYSLRLRLQTNIVDADRGLPQSRSFAASLRLSLSAMPDPGQSFGFRFADGFSNSSDYVELYVADGGAGDIVVFRKQDFVAGTITPLGSAALGAAPVGASMLVLSLSHGTAGSNQIFGSYGYADASGALMGPLAGFANSATAFNGEVHTRLELRATSTVSTVPEPGAAAMLAAGLAGLAWRARRRR